MRGVFVRRPSNSPALGLHSVAQAVQGQFPRTATGWRGGQPCMRAVRRGGAESAGTQGLRAVRCGVLLQPGLPNRTLEEKRRRPQEQVRPEGRRSGRRGRVGNCGRRRRWVFGAGDGRRVRYRCRLLAADACSRPLHGANLLSSLALYGCHLNPVALCLLHDITLTGLQYHGGVIAARVRLTTGHAVS